MTQAASQAAAVSEQAVITALRGVLDPELDESLVELGFVDGVCLEGGDVTVRLRLPTFWCSPNFAYIMAQDAREQVLRLPGVARVRVELKDHFVSDEIGEGVSAGKAFTEVFPGEATEELDELRAQFRRKAFTGRQEQLVRWLLDSGLSPAEVVGLRLGDLAWAAGSGDLVLELADRQQVVRGGAELAQRYLAKRRGLGLPDDPAARLVTDEHGRELAAAELEDYLRAGRRQRLSLVFNTSFCRGMLETRYGLERREGA